MNAFDRGILLGLNHFAHRAAWLDEAAVWINRGTLKGAVPVAFIWWMWFSPRPDPGRARARLVAATASTFVALFVGRILALMLPFRVRPLHEPSLGFVLPYATGPGDFRGWSSFPSDHAMMYFALAVGLAHVSRRAGAFLVLWSLIVVCLPRVYAGLHYPTDILAGALVGGLIAALMQRPALRDRVAGPAVEFGERHAAVFYTVLFVVTFGIATMFSDVRQVVQLVMDLARRARG